MSFLQDFAALSLYISIFSDSYILYTSDIRSREIRSRQTPIFRQWLKNLGYVIAVVILRNIEKCDECDLLVVSDDTRTGNFVFFSDKINKYKLVSAFRNVYLLELESRFRSNSDIKTTKLKNKQRLTKLVKNIILMFKGILYENKQNSG
jgi:hypothetical protein